MRAKINIRILSAIGMLELILKNKWKKDEKIGRTEVALKMAKEYIESIEAELYLLKNKKDESNSRTPSI